MRNNTSTVPPSPEAGGGRGRRLSDIYRDIGLFAVALELNLVAEDLGEEMEDAIERGASYVAPRLRALAS